jgi:hypothetical protein
VTGAGINRAARSLWRCPEPVSSKPALRAEGKGKPVELCGLKYLDLLLLENVIHTPGRSPSSFTNIG